MKKGKFFGYLVAIILAEEALGAVLLFFVFYQHKGSKFSYNETMEEAVERSNEGTLAYWDTVSDDKEVMMVSPMSVQYSLYQDYQSHNYEDVNLFKEFNNGYKSWDESGMYDKSFKTLYPNTEEVMEEILGTCVWQEGAVYAACRVTDSLDGGLFDGEVVHCRADFYDGNLRLNLGDYYLWFYGIGGEGKGDSVDVQIKPFQYQSYGVVNGLAELYGAEADSVVMFCEFGIKESNYRHSSRDKGMYIGEGVDFFVVNKESNLIVLCGRT